MCALETFAPSQIRNYVFAIMPSMVLGTTVTHISVHDIANGGFVVLLRWDHALAEPRISRISGV